MNDSDDDNFNDKTMVRDIAKGCIYEELVHMKFDNMRWMCIQFET